MPAAIALMEGSFVGVIADKVYHVHPLILAVIAAAPMLGNVTSFMWATLARGRHKVPFVCAMQLAQVLGVGVVAFAPPGPFGAALLVLSLIAVRVLLSAEITIRSTIWSLNYPREVRARFTGRLQMLTSLTLALSSFGASLMLDRDPESFRIAYALAAIFGLIGVRAFSSVVHLGEAEQLRLERDAPKSRARSVRAILRADPMFARYQACQFTLGVSNMMIEGSIVYLVSRQLGASYLWSTAIGLALPTILSTATLPLWASYIDRVHIARFRVTQSSFWITYQALFWLGAIYGSLPLLALSRAVLGLSRGGGSLAWQIGHNDFSKPEDLADYMGAHVTLTGVRGAFAPFAGLLLFTGSDAIELFGTGLMLPAFPGLGAHTYGVCLALCLASAIGFIRLEKRIAALAAERSAAQSASASSL